jgi:SAM-dependent methyltransferase/alkylhydroperoxidase family enzyme
MTTPPSPTPALTDGWQGVDEGWGRRAVDFATLSEPANCREYVALHQHLQVDASTRLIDMACGSGLAVELAAARGATCAGIDASARLVAVARDRVPAADIRVGDMNALPWSDASFDVVTSFRGIWGTTPTALDEARRVLVPGGRLGLTVWGHIKKSPGAWALAPFALAADEKVANQAAMVALGRPGVGEDLLARAGFVDVERVSIPFAWEFADPESYARALVSTGPAFEAIQAIGEEELIRIAVASARERQRDGLPLRAEIDVVGFLARTPLSAHRVGAPRPSVDADLPRLGFLDEAPESPEAREKFEADVEEVGFVMNVSRLWAHQPTTEPALFDLLGEAARAASLTYRDRGILVSATASSLGDSYCSLAWGSRLAGEAGAGTAAAVLGGSDGDLDPRERALATWARRVARDANATTAADVQDLREAGYDDAQIFAITLFVGLRIAFSTINDALAVRPDHELVATTPDEVLAAVSYGRPASVAGD